MNHVLITGAGKFCLEEILRRQWCQGWFDKDSCSLQGPLFHLKEGHKGEKIDQKICTSRYLPST